MSEFLQLHNQSEIGSLEILAKHLPIAITSTILTQLPMQ